MTYKKISILFMGLLILCISMQGSLLQKGEFGITSEQVGYALLDSVVVTFSELSKKVDDRKKSLQRELDKWMLLAKVAKAEGQIDEAFFNRFKRILVVIKLTIIPDPNHHLNPLILEEINKFDISKMQQAKITGLASVSDSLSGEILSLKRYLDRKYKK